MANFAGSVCPMTGESSIHKHGSSGREVASNLKRQVSSGNAVNRSFNQPLPAVNFPQALP